MFGGFFGCSDLLEEAGHEVIRSQPLLLLVRTEHQAVVLLHLKTDMVGPMGTN